MKFQKYLKLLIWPGIATIAAGGVAGFVGGWKILPIVLLILGAVLCGVAISLGGYGLSTFLKSRSTQAGTNALVATLSVLLILGVVNFLGARYDQRIDLTDAQLYTLAPESQTVVRNLPQPVEVMVFDEVPNATDKKLLESYRRFNTDFDYEYVNPLTEPQRAIDFGVQSRPAREAYLQAGEQRLLIQRLAPQEPLSEREITNRLKQLGRENEAVVYFLQGHGEYPIDGSEPGLSQAALRLEDENFEVEAFNLADTQSVPSDAAVVVIAAPERRQFQPLFETELNAIEQYLQAGGSVLLMADPLVTTGLEPLLDRWGGVLDDRLIIDTSGGGQLVGQGPAAPLVTDYGNHPITDELNNGRSFYPLARPVQINPKSSVEATPLLLTNPLTYAETINQAGQLEVDTEQAPSGPYNIGVAFSRAATAPPAVPTDEETPDEETPDEETPDEETPATDANLGEAILNPSEPIEPTDADAAEGDEAAETEGGEAVSPPPNEATLRNEEARLVVIGNVGFATDGRFDQQLNGDIFLNTVTWLSRIDTPTLSIRPKEAVNRRIVMTVQQQILVVVLALLVLPAVGVLGAGVMWFRRR